MTILLYAARGRVPGAWPRPFVSQRQFHRPFRQRACALHTRPIAHAHLPPVWGPAPSLPSFATQFCPNCTLRGLRIEPARARQLVGVAGKNIENPRSHGLWATRGEVTFRVNQTAKCYGPPIIITRDAKSAEALDMLEVPRQWLTKDGWSTSVPVAAHPDCQPARPHLCWFRPRQPDGRGEYRRPDRPAVRRHGGAAFHCLLQ